MKDLFEFKLSQSINTSIGNELKDIDTLYLKCFNIADHRNITVILRNELNILVKKSDAIIISSLGKEILENIDNLPDDTKQDSVKPDISEFILDKLVSVEGKTAELFRNKFIEFFKMKILFKDELLTQSANDIDISKISIEDIEELIAKYIEVFFLPLWKNRLKWLKQFG
tara:strand:+ start:1729 stop:2238 length:510 start_codon:yes stop_codon:yes gene_type:complete